MKFKNNINISKRRFNKIKYKTKNQSKKKYNKNNKKKKKKKKRSFRKKKKKKNMRNKSLKNHNYMQYRGGLGEKNVYEYHHSMTNLNDSMINKKNIKKFNTSEYFKYKKNLLKLSFFNIFYYNTKYIPKKEAPEYNENNYPGYFLKKLKYGYKKIDNEDKKIENVDNIFIKYKNETQPLPVIINDYFEKNNIVITNLINKIENDNNVKEKLKIVSEKYKYIQQMDTIIKIHNNNEKNEKQKGITKKTLNNDVMMVLKKKILELNKGNLEDNDVNIMTQKNVKSYDKVKKDIANDQTMQNIIYKNDDEESDMSQEKNAGPYSNNNMFNNYFKPNEKGKISSPNDETKKPQPISHWGINVDPNKNGIYVNLNARNHPYQLSKDNMVINRFLKWNTPEWLQFVGDSLLDKDQQIDGTPWYLPPMVNEPEKATEEETGEAPKEGAEKTNPGEETGEEGAGEEPEGPDTSKKPEEAKTEQKTEKGPEKGTDATEQEKTETGQETKQEN